MSNKCTACDYPVHANALFCRGCGSMTTRGSAKNHGPRPGTRRTAYLAASGMTSQQLAEKYGMSSKTVHARLKRGVPLEHPKYVQWQGEQA